MLFFAASGILNNSFHPNVSPRLLIFLKNCASPDCLPSYFGSMPFDDAINILKPSPLLKSQVSASVPCPPGTSAYVVVVATGTPSCALIASIKVVNWSFVIATVAIVSCVSGSCRPCWALTAERRSALRLILVSLSVSVSLATGS